MTKYRICQCAIPEMSYCPRSPDNFRRCKDFKDEVNWHSGLCVGYGTCLVSGMTHWNWPGDLKTNAQVLLHAMMRGLQVEGGTTMYE